MVVLAMWIFRSLLRELGCRGAALEAATAIVFLTTPIWHYARVLYSESFTLALVLAAFTMRLWRTDRPLTGALAPGALLALAILVRPASALFALPLAIDALLRRRASDLVLFVSSPTLAVAALLALNDAMFGSPWRTAQPLHLGDFWNGLTGILLSARSGLLLYAPALLLALAAWPGFLRAQRRPALLALGMVVPSLLLVASWLWWHGGHTYGPRLIVPLIPFIFLPMARVGSMPALRRRPVQLTAGALVLLGLAINWQGAFEHRDHLARHPLREEIRWLKAAAAPETRQRATMPR
jgi:hypothetical protein